ncbi:MAG: RnfABCDGE type electron transport complex subunit D [Gemmatimonadetes bacterium]|nr:RnfABCDGE type electron transport complex subunit D [Gemmatimonadota bacterium]
MTEVLIALVPVVAAAVVFFGPSALLVLAASTLGSVLAEWAFGGRRGFVAAFRDGSAPLTGLLLGLTLPPAIPLWMAVLGGAVAIALGKTVFGGLGQNVFNPALVGRAFLQAAFPTVLTTWSPPAGEAAPWLAWRATNFAFPFLSRAGVDSVTAATPLSLAKFQGVTTAVPSLLSGHTAGSLGETSAGLLLLLGIVMAVRRLFDWRIPLAILLAVAAFGGLLHVLLPARCPSTLFLLFSGGLLLGAVFMATDPVTSPVTPRGAWVFGAGIGVLVVLIRLFGGLPEGVMYAILLMNAMVPHVDRWTQPRPFGRGRAA